MAPKTTIVAVKEKYEAEWLRIQGVEGVGIGEEGDHPVIQVYVSGDPRSLGSRIPGEIEGYPVRLVRSGKFHALE